MNRPGKSSSSPAVRAVALSAFVLPGLGQFCQKGYVAGTVFLSLFLLFFLWFCGVTLGLVAGLYRFAATFADPGATVPHANVTGILMSFSLSLGVYVANVVDAWRASRRSRRRPPPPPLGSTV